MSDQTSDIKVLTDELRRFGHRPLGVETGGTAQLAAAAGGGGSMMAEAVQLQTTHQAAAENVLGFMKNVDRGLHGYRQGVQNIANTYDATEGEVLTTFKNLMPMDAGLPAMPKPSRRLTGGGDDARV